MNFSHGLSLVVFGIFIGIQSQASLHGGITGGGGNVISPKAPEQAQDPRAVRGLIEEALHTASQYLRSKLNLYRQGKLSPSEFADLAPLLKSVDEAKEMLQETRVHIREGEPCYDPSGTAYDGSFRASEHGHICLSAYNLSQKVDHEQLPAQTAALLVHEYSEILGATDEAAYRAQRRALSELEQN